MSVSGVSSTSATTGTSSGTSASTGVNPTNVGTVTFTGLGSGLNYSQIISQLTAISQQQETPYQNKVTSINTQNTELTKIQNLLSSFQSTLEPLSDASTFNAYSATPSNTSILNATQNSAQTAIAGTYTIDSTSLGTATSIVGATSINKKLSDVISTSTSGGTTITTTGDGTTTSTTGGVPTITGTNGVALADSYAQITPTNGGLTSGVVTIQGVKVSYDVTSQSLQQILSNINSAVQAVDPGFTASYNSNTDEVTLASTDKAISLGSTSDTGNLLSVLKLDTAQISNNTNHGTVTSSGQIGGVNPYQNFSSTNASGDSINANFATAVTAGTFSINGVNFTIDPSTEALSDVISQINSSTAGVTASFSTSTGQLTLVNNTVGAQSIVLGTVASGDTSNFLTATGLSTGTLTLGQQSSLVYTDTTGATKTAYSNTNVISNAIPGFSVSLLATTTTASTVTVAQSATTAETAISNFVTAYNAVINELNNATAAPVVTQNGSSSQSLGGGPFFGNSIIDGLKNQLISLVSSAQSSSQGGYNSLASIGLKLDSTFQVITSGSSSGTSVSGTTNTSVGTSGIGVTTYQGTDGGFQALDTTTFEAAFASNPNAVANLFTNSQNFVTQIGSFLTDETGLSTVLSNGIAGTAPTTSVLEGITEQNSALLTSAQNQIALIQKQITNQANILQTEFTAANANIQSLQSQQAYLTAIGGTATSSSSGS